MADTISNDLRNAINQTVIEPQLILEIDGVSTVYGAQIVTKRILIGDDDLFIGDDWIIGGLNEVADQSDLISWDGGTTTSINQTLNQDKGQGSSISSMQICLIDKNQEATKLISPGYIVDEILGRSAKVYMGVMGDTAFPEDYLVIFRGIIDDIITRQGNVLLDIASPEIKKRQEIFSTDESFTLNGAILADAPSLLVNEMDRLIVGEDEMSIYLKIDDEYLLANAVLDDGSGPALYVTGGQLDSSSANHDDGAEATLVYRLTGNVIDIALKLMLSSQDDEGNPAPYISDLEITHIGLVDTDTYIENSLFFEGVNLYEKYGVTAGDLYQISGAVNEQNNASSDGGEVYVISQVNTTDYNGTLLILENPNEADILPEIDTTATLSVVSRFNRYSIGLGMSPDEVDVDEHLRLQRLFLSGFEVDIFMTESTNGRDFIEQELYLPAGCYSVPRKAKSSIGILSAPIPGTEIKVLNSTNIANAKNLQTRRCLANNFYNEIVYRYDPQLEDDSKFNQGLIERDEDSINRIRSGKKTLLIESKGLRASLNGDTLARAAAQRRLNRYKLAAEEIEQCKVLFKAGFNTEIGDIVLLDASDGQLNLINSTDGNRAPAPKLMEVTNKKVNLKTGEIIFRLLDTSFNTSARYGLISPASKIKSGLSDTQFIIKESYGSIYGDNEYLKWIPWVTSAFQVPVRVHNDDFSVSSTAVIDSINGNVITLKTSLGFPPSEDYIMEFAPYDHADMPDQVKLVFAWFSSTDFADGKPSYQYI